MPANLTPQYLEVEKRFKQARETDEKLSALQEMLAIIPKHKGTEKLRGELKKKLSALRKESALTKPVSRSDSFHVKREGSRQLVLVGCPNSGKSSLLSRLTNAQTAVADYPFSTRTPHPGMLNHQGVNLQLVDLPPVSEHHMDYWLPQIIRNADAVIWVVDLSQSNVLEQMEITQRVLRKASTDLSGNNALIVGNKCDSPHADSWAQTIKETFPAMQITKFSNVSTEQEALAFKNFLYDFLKLVRVYTKVPGKKAEQENPFVLSKGSTVMDLAGVVHNDLSKHFKYAKLWGSGKIEGVRVSRDFVLSDGDIVELHAA